MPTRNKFAKDDSSDSDESFPKSNQDALQNSRIAICAKP